MATKFAAPNLRGYTSKRVFLGVRTLKGDSAKKAVERARRLQARARAKKNSNP